MIIDMENKEFEKNEIDLFENQYMTYFEQLNTMIRHKKDIETKEKVLKEKIEKAMDEYGIKSIDNRYITITRVAGGDDKLTVDLVALEKDSPRKYTNLLKLYPKVVKGKKAYVTFKVKA